MLVGVVVTMFLYNYLKKGLESKHEGTKMVTKASTKEEMYGFLLTTGYSLLVIAFG